MHRLGIDVKIKNAPKLDPQFIPVLKFNEAFLSDAKKPVSIAVERADGQMATVHTTASTDVLMSFFLDVS